MRDIVHRTTGAGQVPPSRLAVRAGMSASSLLVAGLMTLTGASANVAPVVDSFTASPPSVMPGGTVAIVVQAHDPDCAATCTSGCGQYIRADLTSWSATGGTFLNPQNGTSGSPYTATTDWQAPAVEGVYQVSVYLADSGTFMCGGRLSTQPSIEISVTNNPNSTPVVDSVTADPALLFPGGASTVTCNATDPEGASLTYGWTTDLGTVTPNGDHTATFSSPDPGIATVRCTATDPQGMSASETVSISVTSALAQRKITGSLRTPRRLATDGAGRLYVVDRDAGGIVVIDLFTDSMLHPIRAPRATSVAVDWNGALLVGFEDGARVVDRRGDPLLALSPAPGRVADVAVDPVRRRYGVVEEELARVSIYDETGARIAAFGSTGTAVGQFKSPHGLDVLPDGRWVVGDTGNHRVQLFDATGAFLSAFGQDGGAVGEFVRLDDVAADAAGRIYVSDAFQDWIQVFGADGTPLETLGRYGAEAGEFKTATGIAFAADRDSLLAASLNTPSIEVFRTSDAPPPPPPPAASASLTPNALQFGGQAIGTVSASQALTLSNAGGSTLGINRIEAAGDFRQVTTCRGYLDPGESCTIDVSFVPTGPGERRGTLMVTTTADPPRVAAALTGTAFPPAPEAELSPSLLAFGDQTVGTISSPMSATLTNGGLAALLVQSVTVTSPYQQTNACPSSLAPGASCTIEVRFAPTAIAEQVPGSLLVTTDAAGSPHVVALSGRGVAVVPGIVVEDWSGDEGDEGDAAPTVASFTVTLTEATTSTVTVEYLTVADSAAELEDYTKVSGTLTFLPGETTRVVEVPIVGDALLEPDEESFDLLLRNPLGGTIADGSGRGTILDDEECIGPNLLLNAGAEERPESLGVPGWTSAAVGTWTRRGAPPTPYEGNWYFYATTPTLTELVQDIDVSAFAAMIDADRQWFVFQGFVRTLYEASPAARIVVEYRNSDNTQVLDAFDSGELLSPTAWLQVVDERVAPRGTSWIRVRLISFEPGDAYFDGIDLHSLRAATVSVDDVVAYESDTGIAPWSFRVRLACPFHQDVPFDYATRDGSAVSGEDYLTSIGSGAIPRGTTGTDVTVEIVGDTADEYPDETLSLDLEVDTSSGAVALDPEGRGTIRNDDACTRSASWWHANEPQWPVTWLEIGGVEYERTQLLGLLSYSGGGDSSSDLAREVAAAKLNLARGSDPYIQPIVDSADAFLATQPPGSNPKGGARATARGLAADLADYNNHPCDTARTTREPIEQLAGAGFRHRGRS